MSYGKCNKCGCTDNYSCISPKHGNCWWIDGDHNLCSHCSIEEIVNDSQTKHPRSNIFTRDNGLYFTRIQLKSIVKNRKYQASFLFWFEGLEKFPAYTTIAGDSIEHCITKTEEFFKTKLEQSEYVLPCHH